MQCFDNKLLPDSWYVGEEAVVPDISTAAEEYDLDIVQNGSRVNGKVVPAFYSYIVQGNKFKEVDILDNPVKINSRPEKVDSLREILEEALEVYDGKNSKNFANNVYEEVLERTEYTEKVDEILESSNWQNPVELDEFISKGIGNCTIRSAAIASILERGNELGIIDGTGVLLQGVKFDQNSEVLSHRWAEYISEDNERIVIDPNMEYSGQPQGPYLPEYDFSVEYLD